MFSGPSRIRFQQIRLDQILHHSLLPAAVCPFDNLFQSYASPFKVYFSDLTIVLTQISAFDNLVYHTIWRHNDKLEFAL